METQPELSSIVDRALISAAEQYLHYVVFEPQPERGNILAVPQAAELHDVVWNSLRQVLLVWFDGDWDAVQQIILYLEDEVPCENEFDRQEYLLRCQELRPELPTSVELAEDYEAEAYDDEADDD